MCYYLFRKPSGIGVGKKKKKKKLELPSWLPQHMAHISSCEHYLRIAFGTGEKRKKIVQTQKATHGNPGSKGTGVPACGQNPAEVLAKDVAGSELEDLEVIALNSKIREGSVLSFPGPSGLYFWNVQLVMSETPTLFTGV